jgi:16S rRNA processing protein RimM
MNLESCLIVGQIVKAHGLKGEVTAELHIKLPKKYKLESVYLEINQKLVPFFIEKINIADQRAIVKFEDVKSIDDTKSLIKKNLYLPAEKFPEIEEDELSYKHILGFKVKDKSKGELGTIEDVLERAGQDLLVMVYGEKEILIPVDASIILKVDAKKKLLLVDLPEGLLDL